MRKRGSSRFWEENTGKLEEVLRIEAELSRVRGEVERMEGRIRVLENLTALTTVTLEIRERVKFEPEVPLVASFPTQISRSFQDSLNALIELGQSICAVGGRRFSLAAVLFDRSDHCVGDGALGLAAGLPGDEVDLEECSSANWTKPAMESAVRLRLEEESFDPCRSSVCWNRK